MFNEHAQNKMSPNNAINPNLNEKQSLVLWAFLDEEKRWKERYFYLQKQLKNKLSEYKEAKKVVESEPSWKWFLYTKILRRTPASAKKAYRLMDELQDLSNKINVHNANRPDLIRYELAAIGNNLFNPR